MIMKREMDDIEEYLAAEFTTLFAERTFMNTSADVPLSRRSLAPVKSGDEEQRMPIARAYIVSEVTVESSFRKRPSCGERCSCDLRMR